MHSQKSNNYRDNASKLHKAVGEILITSPLFKNYRIYQEYSVKRLNRTWEDYRAKVDWFIFDLGIVIEVMGEQHYYPVAFGGIDPEEAKTNLKLQQMQDYKKKRSIEEAGFIYLTVKYDEKITDLLLFKKYQDYQREFEQENITHQPTFKERAATRQKELRKEAYQQNKNYAKQSGMLERAKEYRRKLYERYKTNETSKFSR